MELSLEVLFLFLLIFSSLFITKQVFNVVLNLISSQPKVLEYTRIEIIMNYLTLTYILTFITQSF